MARLAGDSRMRQFISDEQLMELDKLSSGTLMVPEKFKKLVPNFAELKLKKVKFVRQFRYHFNPHFQGTLVNKVNKYININVL